MIWDPANQSATTFGSLGSVPSDAVLTNPLVSNTGSVSIYIGSGSAAAAVTTGLEVPAGGQVAVFGYSGTVGTAGTIWAQTAVVGDTSSTQVGMVSVPAVI